MRATTILDALPPHARLVHVRAHFVNARLVHVCLFRVHLPLPRRFRVAPLMPASSMPAPTSSVSAATLAPATSLWAAAATTPHAPRA
ncbi:hypothetical protein DFH09DRAFT_1373533, partial [Mycena vulgaris]